MKNDHVVSGSMKKREELMQSLEYHSGEVLKYGAAIVSVDATIRLYDPEFMPESGPLRGTGRSNKYFKTGEAPVLILDYMRDHKGPQPTTKGRSRPRRLAAQRQHIAPVGVWIKQVLKC